ncbi:hypothetical protein [Pseudoalteromonas sp. T1lg75]|uniref:hypothetical protein n=1 Tax=Pseudoalteromonas sp. T1lg75 TaxID=2077102 RepID=UPI000CF729F2|nr:hypothetical protein [Pseudoalteromonas sp. T1lg75]
MFALLLAVGLQGCQSANIHVVAPHLDAQQRQQLSNSFAKQQLKVEFADEVVAPADFAEASITMSPTFYDFALLGRVHDALRQLGYQRIDELRFAQQKHFYRNDHIGVYLLPPQEQRLPLYVESENCHPYRTLMFKADGHWQLDDFVSASKQGLWQRQGERVILTTNEQERSEMRYQLTTRNTHLGERPAHELRPQQVTEQALNCTFVAISM